MEYMVICCPSCKKSVARYDLKGEIDVVADCKRCNLRITYHVDTKKITTKKIPQKATSSGLTFRG